MNLGLLSVLLAGAVVITVAVTFTGVALLIFAVLGETVQVGLSAPFAPLGWDTITQPRATLPV